MEAPLIVDDRPVDITLRDLRSILRAPEHGVLYKAQVNDEQKCYEQTTGSISSSMTQYSDTLPRDDVTHLTRATHDDYDNAVEYNRYLKRA
jgi:hypothetical protein